MKNKLTIFFIFVILVLLVVNIATHLHYVTFKKEVNLKYIKIIEEKDLNEFGKVLYEIYLSEQQGNYDKLKDIFYNVKIIFHDGKVINSVDQFIDGVKNRDRFVGSFSYSPKGCLYHIENIKGNVKNSKDDKNVRIFFDNLTPIKSDIKLYEILEKNPENLYLYEKGSTKLAFVRINGKLKLFFSLDLDVIDKKAKI